MASRRKLTRPHPIERMVGDCLQTPFFHIFVHTLMEASFRDDIMSAYLGGLIPAVSDVGGSFVVGSITHLV